MMTNIKTFAFFKPSMKFVMEFQSIVNISNRRGMHFKRVACSKMLIFVSQFCYLYIYLKAHHFMSTAIPR